MALAGAIVLSLPAFSQTPERGAPLPRRAALGAQLGPAEGGVLIVSVLPGLTAEKLKLQKDDILTTFNGKPVRSPAEVSAALRSLTGGAAVSLTVKRGGQTVNLSGAAVERPRQAEEGMTVVYDQVKVGDRRIRFIATHPKGAGPFPTVMLIGGIGSYSIDGPFASTAYGTVMGPIARAGYATIRVDKPGQGDSEGPAVYTDLLFDEEMAAYLAALRMAKTLPFVDKNKIAIFGHSMGGTFGPLVAAQEKVAGIAVHGTLAKTWFEYTLENNRRQSALSGASAAQIDGSMRQISGVNHYLFNLGWSPERIVKDAPEYASIMRAMSPDMKTMSGVGIPFFQQLAKKNVMEAWAKSGSQVLALYGANDFISGEECHQLIAAAANATKPGSGQFLKLPNSDHGFFKTTSPRDSQQRWTQPGKEFNPNILEALLPWLEKTLKG